MYLPIICTFAANLINMPRIIENSLIAEFKDRASFSRAELFDFFRNFEPNLKEGTLRWRIYDLKNKNIIKTLRRGLYAISNKPKYKPVLSPELLKIAKMIQGKFQEVKYCIWETEWLNEFSQHQTSKRILIIEIEKDFVESLFYYLKDTTEYDLYFNPDDRTIDYYILESDYPIVIKKLLSRSPIGKRIDNKLKFSTPLLEKILVDLFTEKKLFYFYQGSELGRIYENAINNYTINFSKLFSYAKRRKREKEIQSFMKNNMDYIIKDIIDD